MERFRHALAAAVLAPLVVFGALVVTPSGDGFVADAVAENPEYQIIELLERAREGYDTLYFEEATLHIREGLQLAEEHDIQNRDVAELHLFLGLIRHADGEDDLAVDAFIDALETDPDVEVDSDYVTPMLEELIEEAEARAEPPAEQPDEPDEPDEPDTPDDPTPDIDDPPPQDDVDPLTHDPVERVDAGDDLVFTAEIPADLPVFRVHLHHRRYGEEEFTQVEMEPTDATGFEFALDGDQVHTSQLEYFITAIDRAGETIAESGRRARPHRISVIGDRRDDDEPPADSVDDPPDDDILDDPDHTGPYVAVIGGTDIGFLPGGTSPTAYHDRSVSPGLAAAFGHVLLDFGWRITEHNNLGMYFRWQFTPPQDFDEIRNRQGNPEHISQDASFWEHRDECFGFGLPGDCLLGLKYQRVLTDDIPAFYSTLGAGIGRVRNWLQLKQLTDRDDPDPMCEGREIYTDSNIGDYCRLRDTVRTGWLHFGVGGGMYFPVHDYVDIVADSYLMVLVPDTSLNLDINAGVRVTF